MQGFVGDLVGLVGGAKGNGASAGLNLRLRQTKPRALPSPAETAFRADRAAPPARAYTYPPR